MITHDYVSNPQLPIIKEGWKGNPITKKKRFLNHEHPYIPKFSDIFEWKSKLNPDRKQKKKDQWRLPTNHIQSVDKIPDNSITWLGHASFIIKIGSTTILTDPVLNSPTILMPRLSQLPIEKAALKDIDLVLISHDHRDHIDSKSLKRIFKQNPKAKIYTGLNIAPLLSKWTVNNSITEAGWFQSYPDFNGLDISFLPTRHWGKRWLTDTNLRLWGSFMIQYEDKRIFFGGDSGYGNHYKEIQSLFDPIDVSIIGIGAYKPEWFMSPSHTSPEDGYKIATDLKSKHIFPMHYGTFDLSDEAISDPYTNIQDVSNNSEGPKLMLGHPGESIQF